MTDELNIEKVCERCGRGFICRAGKIKECQCSQVQLSDAERIFISEQFRNCLCKDCLEDLKTKFVLWNSKKS
ncbi:cysteine-rich CWC family protein [Flavitalea sp.]